MKLLLYRLLATKPGKFLLRILAFGISIPFQHGQKANNNANIKIVLTIDTEGGYVSPNERRVWQKENPGAFIGYHAGIRNFRALLNKHGIKATFFLNTHGFSATGKEYRNIVSELKLLLKEGHEIGLHPHPDSDFALQSLIGKKFPATSCFFYNRKELSRIISTSKKIIGLHLGESSSKKIKSIRWGNWALNTDGVHAIADNGIRLDSSATPGLRGHLDDTRKYDWSRARRNSPWTLSLTDYQRTTGKKSNVVEFPITTFSFFGILLRADPIYSELLKAALSSFRTSALPENHKHFIVMTHSCEGTTKDGNMTQVLRDLDEFIIFAKKLNNTEFTTLARAGQL